MTRLLFAIPLLIGAAALLFAWVPPHRIWLWKMALVSLEFGHWVALGLVISCVLGWRAQPCWVRYMSAVLVSGLLIPAILASRVTADFSWARLWMPWAHHHSDIRVSEVTVGGLLPLRIYHCPAHSQPSPVVLYIHSGGWDSGDNTEFESCHRELASHGYTIAAMSYQLAPEHPWPAQKEDVKQAVEYLHSHAAELSINPEALTLMGRSAGGQIAAACAYTMPELRAQSVILVYSCMDLPFARKFAFSDDILNSLLLLRQYLGGDPEEVPEAYHSASAIMHVAPSSPPTLMVHGTRDTMVWVKQSQRLTAKLQEAGVQHTFLEFPWATHACDHFPSSPGGQATMQAVLSFLQKIAQ